MFARQQTRNLVRAASQASATVTSTLSKMQASTVAHQPSSLPNGGYESEAVRPKLFIPGPIEFSPEVLKAMSAGARGHTDPTLIEDFGFSLELIRKVFISETAQPFILSGSGATGWDAVACNLLEQGEKALVVASGHFSDRFTECLVQYGVKVTEIHPAKPGMRPSNDEIEKQLKGAAASGSPFKVITITGVDTSTAVLADLKNICEIVKATSPNTLIVVDAVCSAAGEELRMDEWGVDFVLTGSQKAIGVPPGLSVMIASQKAMAAIPPKDKIRNYFVNLPRWLPIMKAYESRSPSYFATPACNTVGALRVGLEQMLSTPGGMDGYFKAHRDNKDMVHATIKNMGLELLTENSHIASNLLTCVRYPAGKKATDVLPVMKQKGWFLAAGLHPQCAAEYFRIGHMGYAVTKTNMVQNLLKDLESVVKA